MAEVNWRVMENSLSENGRDDRGSALQWAAWLGIVAAAVFLRVRGAQNDLWLDEIWSLGLAKLAKSPLDVFTSIHHDNNHYLNTLWLYILGDHGNWPGYRIPSILAGIGTVVLAGLIGHRRNAASACFCMLVVGFSYVLILYSSEARGYAAVVFFSFLCYFLMDSYLETQRWRTGLMFSLAAILGFASHLLFLSFFCSAVLGSTYRLRPRHSSWKPVLVSLLACYLLPTVFLIVLYRVDIRYLKTGGGTPVSLLRGYESSSAWALGLGSTGFSTLLMSAIALAVFLLGIYIISRKRADSLLFFTSVILVMPFLVAHGRHAQLFYDRYFVVGVAFFLILLGFVLAHFFYQGPRGRVACYLLLAAYLAANGSSTARLFQYGRGHYADALRLVAERTRGSAVTIGSDHEFRIPLMLQFYARETMGDKAIKYYPKDSWPREGPEWIIYHEESFGDPTPPGTHLTDSAGNQYELAGTFPTAPLSGFHWFVYHNRAFAY